jgi:queuine/archaeosine tRNA-ribosyltransferase
VKEEFKKNEIFLAYIKCKGELPKSIEEAEKHFIYCNWCHILLSKRKKAEQNKTYISKITSWQENIKTTTIS